jgi:arabinofuranosyltransferase
MSSHSETLTQLTDQAGKVKAVRSDALADLTLFAVCMFCASRVPVSLVDDAFIAYRYAANLVHGFGLVFNPGQRVEGFSDLSWVLLMTVPELLHVRPELFAIAVGSLSAAAALIVVRRTLVTCFGVSRLTAFAVVALAAFNCDYWMMAGNGIESGFYSLILVASLSLLLRSRLISAGAMLGFATTLRPESLALAPLTVVCAVLVPYVRGRDWRASIQSMLRLRGFVTAWVLIVLTVLAWRHSYYGTWLPNSLAAKSHPIHFSDLKDGLWYVVRFIGRSSPWPVLALCALFLHAPVFILAGFVWLCFHSAVVLPNSGDWMPGYRLVSVLLPVAVLLAGYVLHRLVTSRKILIWSLAGILMVTSAVQFYHLRWSASEGILARHELTAMIGESNNSFLLLSSILRPALRPRDIVAPEVLGIFSYMLPEVDMHDMLGLVDAHIAKYGKVYRPMFGKADLQYSVHTIRPVLFILNRGDEWFGTFKRETGEEFADNYECWMITNREERIVLAIRRDREQQILNAIRNSELRLRPIDLAGFYSSALP